MKKSHLKSLIKSIVKEALDPQAVMKAVNLESEAPRLDAPHSDETDKSVANMIARAVWPDVVSVEPTHTLGGIASLFVVKTQKGTQFVGKSKDGKWKYADASKGKTQWVDFDKGKLDEMTSTGAVAGYSTPFAFTKNKKGSPKGIEAAKKYGKVVGEAPRV